MYTEPGFVYKMFTQKPRYYLRKTPHCLQNVYRNLYIYLALHTKLKNFRSKILNFFKQTLPPKSRK